jgi:DNA-binding MarR family transcriptional regulator
MTERTSIDSEVDPEHAVGLRIRRAEQAIMARKAEALRTLDLTVQQCMALGFLLDDAAKSCTHMAREANVTSQTMTGIVTNLEAKGFVSRQTSPDHARVHLFSLTETGKELAARATSVTMSIEQDLLGAISDRERAQLLRILDRVTEAALEAD